MTDSNAAHTAVPPLFMFGFERSGTTLLSMIAGAHPDLAVPLTVTGLWFTYGERVADYDGLRGQADLQRLVDDLLGEERIRLWDVQLTREEVLDGLPCGDYPAVVERFHALYARHKGKACWGNLDIATLDHMDAANRWFPEARFVHIVRDGRDVALSHETMPYGASNALECAFEWNHRLRVNLKMGAILGAGRYLVIRYEDLVLDTEAALQRLCAFAGLPYSGEMLGYGQMVEEKVPRDKQWLWPDLAKGPVKANAYRWKRRMSPAKRAVFEGQAGPLLDELGYDVDEPPKSAARYLFELWCFIGYGGRVKRLAAKLGLARGSKLQRQAARLEKRRRANEQVQREAFGELVDDGTYDLSFEHAPVAQRFFSDTVGRARELIGERSPMRVLDAGCGTGYWLDVLARLDNGSGRVGCDYYGFDLTPGMVEVASTKLAGRVAAQNLHAGSILQPESYTFAGAGGGFDLIFTYDVIQQLPSELQREACEVLSQQLAPGGVAVIFDHDAQSPYGRRMGLKKFLTRATGIEFVPKFYCNARYPPLGRIAAEFAARDGFEVEQRAASDSAKCALLLHRAG